MKNQKDILKLRAHHGMCLAFFEGKGYSDTFTLHMGSILEKMRGNPVLQIVTNGDMICKKCPNSKENTCITQEKVKIYDQKVLADCELSKGVTLSWEEFSFLVEERILKKGKRREICSNCQWHEICQRKELERYGNSQKRNAAGD